jgi:PAS domain-containing protein
VPELGAAPGLLDVARRWAATLADTKGVTLPPEELEPLLLEIAHDAVGHVVPGQDGALHRFTALYAASPMGIALADPDGEVVEANLALGQLLGCSPDKLRGRHLTDFG